MRWRQQVDNRQSWAYGHTHKEHGTSQHVEVLLELPHLLGAHVANLLHDLVLPAEHLHDGHSLIDAYKVKLTHHTLEHCHAMSGVGNLNHFGELLYPLIFSMASVTRSWPLGWQLEVNTHDDQDACQHQQGRTEPLIQEVYGH
jgi:hypothetical protein